jgi:hypothetical protein
MNAIFVFGLAIVSSSTAGAKELDTEKNAVHLRGRWKEAVTRL